MTNPNMSQYGKEYRFKPGNKGGGRKPGSTSIATKLRQLCGKNIELKNPMSGQKEKKEIAEWIALSLIREAMRGNTKAITTCIEYLDGKVVQTNEHTGKDGSAIQHNVKVSVSAEHWDNRMSELMDSGD